MAGRLYGLPFHSMLFIEVRVSSKSDEKLFHRLAVQIINYGLIYTIFHFGIAGIPVRLAHSRFMPRIE